MNNFKHSSSYFLIVTSVIAVWTCECFIPIQPRVVGRHTVASWQLKLSTKGNNGEGSNHKKQQKKKQKKRRFAQDVDSVMEFTVPMVQRPLTPTQQKTTKGDSKGNFISGNKSNSRSKKMMQSEKSIEELESIMMKRWGTTNEEWTTDFDEWEIVVEEEKKNDVESDSNRRLAQESLVSGRKLKSKPVLNPWEKDELLQNSNSSGNKESNVANASAGDKNNVSLFQSNTNQKDAVVLDRVKKNQERFQSKMVQQSNTKSRSFDPSSDYFDEDDEGYETFTFDDDDDNGRMAGGFGSSTSSGGNASAQGTFFFREQNAQSKMSSLDEFQDQMMSMSEKEMNIPDAKRVKKQKAQKPLRKPLLDDVGNEMYLTLEQANRNVEAFVGTDNDSNVQVSPTTSWQDVGITNSLLLRNLDRMGCVTPLSVQDQACPAIVSGNDVLISTHTGSGKTLAFLAPLAESLLVDEEQEKEGSSKSGVKVVVIAPGRELASQIVDVARDLFQGTHLKVVLAIGGTPFLRNYEKIRKGKPHLIVGTPGRIAELVVGKPGDKSGKMKVNDLQAIVLDECDALLEYEPHREPTTATMNLLKRRHEKSLQCILCSATAGDLMGKSLLERLLRPGYSHAQSDKNDKLITSGDDAKKTRVSRTVIHGVVRVDHQRFALDALKRILYTNPAPQQVLVFVDNSRRVGVVVEKLAEFGIIAAPLHGGQGSEKGDRAEVNKALREGYIGIVVATEMAARGIDAPYLTHVINLDLPTDASHYAHRAGRCGRGGRPGVVVNIAVGSKEKNVPLKFANALDIEMYSVEPRGGKLVILEQQQQQQ
jgi:Superfamily II DNA and RNA helicases